MNKIEAIKTERDGLAVKEMIAHYARTGWEAIPEDDVQRLKMRLLTACTPEHASGTASRPRDEGEAITLPRYDARPANG